MTIFDRVTVCMTMGLRPDHLRRTLESLSPEMRRLPIVAINDFGDEPTYDMFRELCPHGRLVDLGGQVGHTRAVDAIYQQVETEYVFHIEDDWKFTRHDFLQQGVEALSASDRVTCVCFRSQSDMKIKEDVRDRIERLTLGGHEVIRLDGTSDKFFGYTFNPHIAPISLWKEVGGFSQFRGEGKISQHFRGLGRYCVFLDPGACRHIGWRESARRGHVKQG